MLTDIHGVGACYRVVLWVAMWVRCDCTTACRCDEAAGTPHQLRDQLLPAVQPAAAADARALDANDRQKQTSIN